MVTIYSTTTCPSCVAAKIFFYDKGVPYKTVNIEEKNISREEIVKKIDNLLVSTADNGVQTHESLFDGYTGFIDVLALKKVQKPAFSKSDDHNSQFDPNVLRLMENNLNFIFIGTPDTTGVTQTLDQINQDLHACYRGH